MKKSELIRPVIKWTGSKRTVAPIIGKMIPRTSRYFDPFVGGGAILPFRKSTEAHCGDIIPELIDLWSLIKKTPHEVLSEYSLRWRRLQTDGHEYFYEIRKHFNSTRNPHDLLFLSRTCVNGLIRFNSKSEFNNSFHHGRPGIHPSRLKRILDEWHQVVKGTSFYVADYRELLERTRESDFVFLDPPYNGTVGRYLPLKFNMKEFFEEIHKLNSKKVLWILTLDGKAGSRDYQNRPPDYLFKKMVILNTGNSTFTKVMRKSVDRVEESVYLNFDIG